MLQRKHGEQRAKLLRRRLDELHAATNLEQLRPLPGPRCHELRGNRKGQLSVDLDHPYRLIFVPDHSPPPERDDGGLNWVQITKVLIIGVVDTHD